MMDVNWIKQMFGGHDDDKPALPERTSVRESPSSESLIDADETLVGELTRARRFEQILTIVVVSAAQRDETVGERSGTKGNGADGPNVLPLLAAVGLREALRESDVLCYRPMEGRFVLGLPQSDGEEARQAMDRVGELFHRRLRIDLLAGAASFPADGLTLEDLENTALDRAAADDLRPPRQVPPHRTRARSRGRSSRAGAPSEIAREALGRE